MGAYLIDNKPARSQFRSPRRLHLSPLPGRLTGCVCIHTAESVMDTIGPDTGAENVAAWMTRRDTPGSYHDLADSDSYVHLVDYGDEAFQDGTGSNPWALSISFALAAADWPRLSATKRAAFLAQGALAFAAQQRWLRHKGYPLTLLRRITKAQSDAGASGFISHGDRDPGRRTDPGEHFPWQQWFAACAHAMNGTPTPEEEDDMPTPDEIATAVWRHAITPGADGEDGQWMQTLLRKAARADKRLDDLDDRVIAQTRAVSTEVRTALARQLAALSLTAEVDEQALAKGIVDTLPDTLAQQVLDGLRSRLETP